MYSNEKSTVFKLTGGLGNQLFVLHAAMYYSSVTGREIALDPSEMHRQHGRGLYAFDLPRKLILGRAQGRLLNFASRVPIWDLSDSFLKRAIANKFSVHKSLDSGPDSQLEQLSNAYVAGYFQTYKYLNYLSERGLAPALELAKPTKWYLRTLENLSAEPFIAMHLRLGDYLYLKDSYGVLAPEYYIKAFGEVTDTLGSLPLVIFSDDVAAVRDFSRNLGADQIVIPPVESDPAESLLLMSRASGLVMANSTYSWWAANLGESSKVAAAPDPWFLNNGLKPEFLQKHWSTVESIWQQ